MRLKVIPGIIVCLFLVAALFSAGCSRPCGGFTLYRIDEPNPPEGKIVHLTDKDFSDYPDLGSTLQNPRVYHENATLIINGTETRVSDLGSVHVSCNEQMNKYDSLSSRYPPIKYLEYRGKLYYFEGVWVY